LARTFEDLCGNVFKIFEILPQTQNPPTLKENLWHPFAGVSSAKLYELGFACWAFWNGRDIVTIEGRCE
jgi:hypothetical protein